MKINWKVRIKNPVFWANLAAAIILPILTYLGLNWSDMTTWAGLGGVLLEAVKNLINDPTTKGLGDSERALGYTEPNK